MGNRWFRVKGQAQGERSLREQMQGLTPAFLAAKGKTVLDLGCAEGLLSLEFAESGAKTVHGIEAVISSVNIMRELIEKSRLSRTVEIYQHNLNLDLPAYCFPKYDIVLALGILHKLCAPESVLKNWAMYAADLLVIRLPGGSSGKFLTKHHSEPCDTLKVMGECNFTLEGTEPGPRSELVQYWRRRGHR